MITGIQIVALLFSVLMLYVTYLHLKRKEIDGKEAIFFFTVWTVSSILTVFPTTANFILNTFHIIRLLDLATIVGFMILVAISYSNFVEIRKMRNRIEKLVRKRAIENVDE
ncbi:MAG: hypothetical protein UT63_C0003G0008 [Candidatus Gottesmanbacteria bacterium GW2011_GWC2_39_8]|uniref:DUF2304 domain-containing protein n=1 Tax=Candidatus Gottesmanbacteria bacterium GW2011_GWC2_39_8 TaxID=1618450 RepID=A0A0G0T8V2_9BACT|nr:MAG: hypothetical protein UT63_C0003G0008 [Candidatus Gottesmanbacteria bacterium GW2011_GWC2_39_8]